MTQQFSNFVPGIYVLGIGLPLVFMLMGLLLKYFDTWQLAKHRLTDSVFWLMTAFIVVGGLLELAFIFDENLQYAGRIFAVTSILSVILGSVVWFHWAQDVKGAIWKKSQYATL